MTDIPLHTLNPSRVWNGRTDYYAAVQTQDDEYVGDVRGHEVHLSSPGAGPSSPKSKSRTPFTGKTRYTDDSDGEERKGLLRDDRGSEEHDRHGDMGKLEADVRVAKSLTVLLTRLDFDDGCIGKSTLVSSTS